jgi:amidohydrolase
MNNHLIRIPEVEPAYLSRIRRTLHMYPELSFDLPRTLALVRSELEQIEVPYTEKYGRSSIVATLNEDKKAFTIGIRADMDALPVQEINEVPYKSKIDGKMHACGHDAHTAMLLGAVRALAQIKDQLQCRVKFLFQPSEEGMDSGAREMVADGVMDDIDIIIACHMDNAYEVGTVGFLAGPAMASNHAFTIELFGKSGHAVFPHTAADTIAMGVRIYSELQMMLTREIDPFALRVLSFGIFQAGETNNVIPDYCRMVGTLRTHSDQIADFIMRRMNEIVEDTTRQMGGRGQILKNKHLPVVYNDRAITERLIEAARKVVDPSKVVIMEKPKMSSEDFSLYQTKKPGVFYRIGSRNEQKGFVNMPHRNNWDIDEDALPIGVKVFAQFVVDNMNGLGG